jgi:hypothetical protein
VNERCRGELEGPLPFGCLSIARSKGSHKICYRGLARDVTEERVNFVEQGGELRGVGRASDSRAEIRFAGLQCGDALNQSSASPRITDPLGGDLRSLHNGQFFLEEGQSSCHHLAQEDAADGRIKRDIGHV